jgi:5-deoxy-glucuronate isomerase
MQQYDLNNLVIHAGTERADGLLVEVTPALAGWETINFQARRLAPGGRWSFSSGENEVALIALSGTFSVHSNYGDFHDIGSRSSVFTGLPAALYLPRGTELTVHGQTDCEFAAAWAKADADFPARQVRPQEITTEIRGGDNATRQINSILPPGFPCSRLVVVEVYTPSGNWSSYPPHKHDVIKNTPDGSILEADLEEIYYYKIDRPEGYAFQRIYTAPESPLHKAGLPIDAVVTARNNDVVLVPEGYHPVVSPPGYTSYYLNVLAGSAQSLAATDDPTYTWVKGSYRGRDPRVPLYPVNG